jgi:signal peptidase I
MSPTIKPGTQITIDWTAYALSGPKRWDVVCFEPPTYTNQIWAMRVVGLPGETVSFAVGGIAVNGRSVALPSHITNVGYVSLDHPALRAGSVGGITSPYVVPSNSFFVLGDNSTNALDSRFWGAVQRTNIFGKVRGV